MAACDQCLARTWLIARLASHLEPVRARIASVLQLGDEELIEAVAGDSRTAVACELERFDRDHARDKAAAAGVAAICRCDPRYPRRLRVLPSPPAVLHVAGDVQRLLSLTASDPVAIVGARRASGYGLAVARGLGRGLGAAGVAVVSGMALGIDSAAHAGALDGGGGTIAVLPGSAESPYPAAKRSLHRRIVATGAAMSELPPGTPVWRWMFPARNRVIAALSALTVVVEAGDRSGALLTAAVAGELSRPLGAVPGQVTAPLATGPNRLLARGAHVIRGAQDALDILFGAGVRTARDDDRPPLDPPARHVLEAIAAGNDTPATLERSGLSPEEALAAVAALELAGYVRREAGGRFSVLP